MRTAILTTFAAIVLVAGVLVFVARPERWPPPEVPPRQGEALDRNELMERRVVHSTAALSHLIREPQNTWSNLAYLAGGALLLGSSASSRSARSLGLALIGVGMGSFLYHASASRTLRHLDVGAMYWVFLSAILFSLGSVVPRFRIWTEKHGMALGVITLALGGVGAALRNVTIAGVKPLSLPVTIGVAATVLIAALLLAAMRRRSRSAVIGSATAMVAFGAAVVFQIGDRPGGFLCDPAAPIQAHALWHCLSALAFVVAVRTIDRPLNSEPPYPLTTQPDP